MYFALARMLRIMESGTPAWLKGHKSKSHNAETQATGGRFRLTAAPAEHYLRPIPPTTYSVAQPSEIKKLEQRYRENPKGRNFAPLADAYRKAGLLDHAIELCKSGLQRHPDYVSAHIVYGRCLIDQKNDPGASGVFRNVLALAPENVLALKILAEIAERGGRYDEAADWLSRLLSADPMNGDAAEALTRARSRAARFTGHSSPSPAAPPARAAAPQRVVRLVPEPARAPSRSEEHTPAPDRKSTRLNSSHPS